MSKKPINGKPSPQEKVAVNVTFIERDKIVKAKMVIQETTNDPVLREVFYYAKNCCPEKTEERLQPYYNKRLELTHEDGVLLWISRVVIPELLPTILLKDLYAEHLGMVKMKQLARKYLWWPRLDKEIEETVKLCTACQETAKAPPSSQRASWSWPAGPWKPLHLDLAGPYHGKTFLVIVDAYSK